MSGFSKIDFGQNRSSSTNTAARPSPASQSTTPIMPVRKSKSGSKFYTSKPFLIIIGILVIIIIAIGLLSIPAYATYKSGLQTYRESKVLEAALKSENLALTAQEVTTTKADLLKTQTDLHNLAILKYIPIANWYYNDADHLMNAGNDALTTASIITTALTPYADVLGLKGSGTYTGGPASTRIQTAVLTMGKITPQIDTIAQQLTLIKNELDQVDPNHYPSFIFGHTVGNDLTGVKTSIDEAATFVNNARPLVKILPSLLGATEPKKYMVIFENDKELRPTGGFITGYAIIDINQGIISIEKSDDIYPLDDTIPDKPPAPAPILKYFPGVYVYNLRDSNLSPDFVVSMQTFNSMYQKAGEYEPVDGIISIDTNVLVTAIQILDNTVTANGVTFNTDPDAQCNCPEVIYALEDSISRPVDYYTTTRKSILGALMQAIMVKALSSSPKKYWGPLFQDFITQTQQKHILFDLDDASAQQGIESLNAAGQVLPFNGDYLYINETNFSGAKVNIFLQEAVTNSYSIGSDGTITKTVTINYKDPFPPSDCSLKTGGLCLNAEYRDWFRILVPQGSTLVSSNGSEVNISTYNMLGKTFFEGFLTVNPEGVQTLTVTYKLPFKLANGSPLPVMIQKQPGTYNIQYTNVINGRTVDTFPLLTDHTESITP